MIDFNYYIGFFHDGSLNDILHQGSDIYLKLTSWVVSRNFNKDNLLLDENNCLKGELICKSVVKITLNEKKIDGTLEFNYDEGDLVNFDLNDNEIEIGVYWKTYRPQPCTHEFCMIKITASQIIWQDALNPICLDLTGMKTGKYK